MNAKSLKIAIVAGESSGDNLGEDLIKSLQKIYPDAQFKGIAGPKMQALGCQSLYPMEKLSVIGIWAILKRLPEFLKLRKTLAKSLIDWQADVFIGIDAPEFNLGLAKLMKQGGVKTVHYVSPSVWAWRKKRIFKIKQSIDLMLTLFPFEVDIYHEHKIPVCCVGHPLAYQYEMNTDTSGARADFDLAEDDRVLAVLPGSRMSEIEYLGHLFLEVVAELQHQQTNLKVLIPTANTRTKEKMQEFVDGMEHSPKVTFYEGEAKQVMAASDVVLLASGTASLEALLLKKPMVVAYKVSNFSYWIYMKLVSLRYFSLPNLLAGHRLVMEYIQSDAEVENICKEVNRLFKFGLTEQLHTDFNAIHQSLLLGGGDKAAEAIKEQIFRDVTSD